MCLFHFHNMEIGPSIDEASDENRTIATLAISKKWYVMHNGRKKMPILLDEQYFKLHP